MKITFRGWKREVTQHERKVAPVRYKQEEYIAGSEDAPLQWRTSERALGKVSNLSLTGDFLVEIDFKVEELRNWLKKFVKEDPEAAAVLLSEAQGEMLVALARKATDDALSQISK